MTCQILAGNSHTGNSITEAMMRKAGTANEIRGLGVRPLPKRLPPQISKAVPGLRVSYPKREEPLCDGGGHGTPFRGPRGTLLKVEPVSK